MSNQTHDPSRQKDPSILRNPQLSPDVTGTKPAVNGPTNAPPTPTQVPLPPKPRV